MHHGTNVRLHHFRHRLARPDYWQHLDVAESGSTDWSGENVPECHAGDVLRAGVCMHCVLAGPAVADRRPPGVYRFLSIVYCHHKRCHNLE